MNDSSIQLTIDHIVAALQDQRYATVHYIPPAGKLYCSYSVGLARHYGAPELLVFGRVPELCAGIIRAVADGYRAGYGYADGAVLRGVAPTALQARSIGAEVARACAPLAFLCRDGDAAGPAFRQLVPGDARGRFPGQPRYKPADHVPPLWDAGYEAGRGLAFDVDPKVLLWPVTTAPCGREPAGTMARSGSATATAPDAASAPASSDAAVAPMSRRKNTKASRHPSAVPAQ